MSAGAPHPAVPSALVTLSSHRWNVPVIGALHTEQPLAFGRLVGELGASRDGLSRALTALAPCRIVEREPGRRGAYRLGARGTPLGGSCRALLVASRDGPLSDLAFRKWTLPIVAALRGWEIRFAELRALLPGISPRALTIALKDMQAAGLVTRTVIGGFPPATSYRLTERAAGLAVPLDRLRSACIAPVDTVD